jgi:acetyl esterase
MPILEPVVQMFVDALQAKNDPPIYSLPVEAARKVLEDAQGQDAFVQAADFEEVTLPSGVTVTIVRPHALHQTEKIPGVVYLHGGGWILGSFHTHQRLVRLLAAATNAAFLFVNYSPSPESRYPVALEQAYETFHYFVEHGGKHRIDGSRISIAGDSAGGNMATAVCLLSIERNAPVPRSQALLYPVTSAAMDTHSYDEFSEGPWLSRKSMEWFWNAYAPSPVERELIQVSPVLAPLPALSGMPETLVLTGECDVLRDEGEAYARRLMEAQVKTTSLRYLGTMHDFMMLDGVASSTAAKHAVQTASEFLRGTLSR